MLLLCHAAPLAPVATAAAGCHAQCFGLNRSVALLKGSKSKQVEPWMQELTGPDGSKLHGAGSKRSEEWWKGLGNVLMGQGYLASNARKVCWVLGGWDASKSTKIK